MKRTAVFIPAGGSGTRLAPLTDSQPKPCLPIYFDNHGRILRFIDMQIALAKHYNMTAYVYTRIMEHQFDYLRSDKDVVFRHTDAANTYEAYLQALSDFEKDVEVDAMICLPSDVIMPEYVFNLLIDTIERKDVNSAVLCSKTKMGMITNSNEPHYYNDSGFLVRKGTGANVCYDLGIYLSKIGWDIKKHAAVKPDKIGLGIWKNIYSEDDVPASGVAICLPKPGVVHLDAGTPEPYYEALRKFNNQHIDSNGNIVFPGARINAQSTDSIALPGSDSSSIILHRDIVPTGLVASSLQDVLHVPDNGLNFWGDFDINHFPVFR